MEYFEIKNFFLFRIPINVDVSNIIRAFLHGIQMCYPIFQGILDVKINIVYCFVPLWVPHSFFNKDLFSDYGDVLLDLFQFHNLIMKKSVFEMSALETTSVLAFNKRFSGSWMKFHLSLSKFFQNHTYSGIKIGNKHLETIFHFFTEIEASLLRFESLKYKVPTNHNYGLSKLISPKFCITEIVIGGSRFVTFSLRPVEAKH